MNSNNFFVKFSFLIVLFSSLLLSCGKDESFATYSSGELIKIEEVLLLSKNQIVANAYEFDATNIVEYDLKYYVLTYRTTYQNKPIDTRGLLIVPQGIDSLTFVSYTHGTHIPLKLANVEKNTPSNYRGENSDFIEVINIASPIASNGYALFLPDYIGYGLTEKKEHPFIFYPELVKSIVDGLKASKSYLEAENLYFDNRLFLTGWSQGAGAALFTHKTIQEQFSSEFNVIATSGLAGPYNFFGFFKDVIDRKSEEIELIGLYTWGLYSINKFSDTKRPTDQLFSYPVFDQISALRPPSNVPENIFVNFFINKIGNETDVQMSGLMKSISTHANWLPQGKVFLHHGTADDIVPYFNSNDAYNGLLDEGADVTLYSYPGGDHNSELENYVRTTIQDFNLLK